MSFVDYYAVLGVKATASQGEIHRAYRTAALRLHPDQNPDASPDAWHTLVRAHEVLGNADQRAAFDLTREARRAEAERRSREDSARAALREDLELRERSARGSSSGRADAAAGSVDPSAWGSEAGLEALREEMEQRRRELGRRRQSSAPDDVVSLDSAPRKDSVPGDRADGAGEPDGRFPLPLSVLRRPERLPDAVWDDMERAILRAAGATG
jgi:curved DNA-binding protein CbpA